MTSSSSSSAPRPNLRELWRNGATTLGLWAQLPSSSAAQTLAQTGVDYVCVDNQHGLVDHTDTVPMIQGITAGGSNPIARAPWNEPGIIGKLLDAGSQAVIVPMVNSPEEAQAAVAACRYPPLGARSWGPVVPLQANSDYFNTNADDIGVVVMVETVQALNQVDAIVSTPGVDAVYVGPADLSISLGLGPGNHDDQAAFTDALTTIVSACDRHGVVAGIHSTGALTPRRIEQGFRMITVTADLVAMRLGLTASLAQARQEVDASGSGSMY